MKHSETVHEAEMKMYSAMRRCRNHDGFLKLGLEMEEDHAEFALRKKITADYNKFLKRKKAEAREDRDKNEKLWSKFTSHIFDGTITQEKDKNAEPCTKSDE
jgi:hypothetical protein